MGPGASKDLLQQHVDRPGLAEQKEPRDDVEHVGDAERDDRGNVEKLPQWRVRPFRKPCLRRPDHEREQRRPERIGEAVDERRAERALREDGREVPEGEGAEPAAGIESVQARISEEQERRDGAGAGKRDQDDDLGGVAANERRRTREGAVRQDRHHLAKSS